jgi:NADH dehydrogenase
MSRLVTIFGGSGFVGRYIAREMAQRGWRVRVAVRRPNEAIFVRTYGVVGQVEPVLCNIRDDASVAAALRGAEAAVNCVGILAERGKNKFNLVQNHGAARVARLATEAGVSRLVHISAIGADSASDSVYAESKARGEAAVLEHFPRAMILRPSIVFGPEDGFFNRFAGMATLSPVLPLVGADTRFQPVHVGDVALAAAHGVTGEAAPGIYELGGPDVQTFRELMRGMLAVIRRRKLLLPVPFPVAMVMGGALDLAQAMTLGLLHNGVLTRDQVRNLRRDNVVSGKTRTLADLGVTPTPMAAVLPEYLWRYRPSGQYSDIKDSASNLRS